MVDNAIGHGWWTLDHGPWMMNCEEQEMDPGQWTMGNGSLIVDRESWTIRVHHRSWTVDHVSGIMHGPWMYH